MADPTGKKLLRLLQADQPPVVRGAAALIIGEVGNRDEETAEALVRLLKDPDPALRQQVVETVGKLRIEKALPVLLDRVREGGPEGGPAAAAAARLGARGVRFLQDLMEDASPGLRRRIAAALAAAGTASAETAAVDSLLDNDPGVIDAACRNLIAGIPELTATERRALVDHLIELLGPKRRQSLSGPSEAALLRLLAALADPRGEAILWDRAGPEHPPEIQASALQGLGTRTGSPTPAQVKRLLACAGDRDFRIAAPALMMLKAVPVADRNLADWLPLLDAPDVAARRFALEKFGDRDHADVVAALVRQLGHPDRALRQEALDRLGKLERGRQALVQSLLDAEGQEPAWSLARAQANLVKEYSPALRAKLLAQACKYLEAADARAEPLLFLLGQADAKQLRADLEARALTARKKKQYPTALAYLRRLGRDPACGEALRFEFAACGIKESSHDLAAEARAADPSLHQFARLIASHDTDPAEYVEKAKWLEPEELFYLGFHFVEGRGPEKDFGARVLRLLLKRSPRSALGKDARNKLRSQGLE